VDIVVEKEVELPVAREPDILSSADNSPIK